MSQLLAIDVETDTLSAALRALPDAVRARCNEASRETAFAIVREAKSRLARQLGPNATGQTVAGIDATPAHNGDGYIVLADREPMPNLPLWLEKGTRPGKRKNYARTPAKPFFYSSIALEVGPHERRIEEAMGDAADLVGLGD